MTARVTRMWFAGAGWHDDHYTAAVLDEDGLVVFGPAIFQAHEVDDLVAALRTARHRGGGLATVIDTTSGVLERHLVEAGLDVYRADPWQCAERPAGGSVDAATLAESGCSTLSALTRLTIEGGGLSGRDDEDQHAKQTSLGLEQDLAAAGRLIVCGSAGSPEIALTFDDGPSPQYTAQILNVLRRYEAVATFFCVGLNAHAYPAIVERIAEEGHVVANHTWSHPYLPDLSRGEIEGQLERTNEVLARITGEAPTLVRPPYGGRNADVMRWLSGSAMTTVLWDVDTSDWALPGDDAIEREIVGQSGPGSVVLMHDGGGERSQTVAALPRALGQLRERGYRFVSVNRLLESQSQSR